MVQAARAEVADAHRQPKPSARKCIEAFKRPGMGCVHRWCLLGDSPVFSVRVLCFWRSPDTSILGLDAPKR